MRLVALVALVVFSSVAFAHPGGLDKYGCHTDHSTGGYHCHNGGSTGGASSGESAGSSSGAKTVGVALLVVVVAAAVGLCAYVVVDQRGRSVVVTPEARPDGLGLSVLMRF